MKSLLLTVSLVLLSNIVFGQETSKKYQKYKAKYGYEEGYIKTLQGEKVSGLIKRPGGLGIKEYKKVVFISKEGTRYAYAPYNIQGYEFGHQQYISGRSHFYKRISGSDEVGLYEIKVVMGAYGGVGNASYASSVWYVKRSSEKEFTEVRRKKFKSTFVEYFSDCPRLQKKIDEEVFTHKNPREMIEFYHSSCYKRKVTEMKSKKL